MANRTLKILGLIGLIASGGLALFLVLTQSSDLFHWYGDESGNPTGQTVVIPSYPFKSNKIHLVIGDYFQYVDQEHEIGTFNLTRQGTGEQYSVSYELESGTFVGFEYEGAILELPAGTYVISAENHHYDTTPCNHVVWQIMQAGHLRFSGYISGDIPDDPEGWMFTLLGLGTFLLSLFSVLSVVMGYKKGESNWGSKSKKTFTPNYPVKSFVELSPHYHPPGSATTPSSPLNATPLASPKPPQSEPSISTAELNLIAQAALKKASSQQIPPPNGVVSTKPCPSCGKMLPANSKFCSFCGQQF